MFRSVWKSFNSEFNHILNDMKRHKSLIQEIASALHISQYQMDREETSRRVQRYIEDRNKIFAEFEKMQEDRSQKRCTDIYKWLGASTSTTVDHDGYCRVREQNPSSQCGQWIFGHENMENWIDPDVLPPSSILWLTGIMGAGMFL